MPDLNGHAPSLALVDATDPGWSDFVGSHPQAMPFHHPSWANVIAQTYGYRSAALVLPQPSGGVAAGIPVIEIAAGRAVVALPFTDYCPLLANSTADAVRFSQALKRWQQLSHSAVTVHSQLEVVPGIYLLTRGVRHVLRLDGRSDEVLASLAGGPIGRAVRKAQRTGLRVRFAQGLEDFEPFYRLHLNTRRRHGVPIQPKRFLRMVWRDLIAGGLGFVLLAEVEGRAVATALFLMWNGTVIYKFGASDPQHWQLRPNNLIMWTAIEHACHQGIGSFDFGRSDSDNRGLREFKSRWGATEIPLVYSYVAAAPPSTTPRFATRALATVIRSTPPVVCQAIGELLYSRAAGLSA